MARWSSPATALFGVIVAVALAACRVETNSDGAGAVGGNGNPGPGGSSGAGGAASGADDLFIVGVVARKDGACDSQADHGLPLWSSGVVDRLLVLQYPAVLLIGNNSSVRVSLRSVEV